MEENESLFLLMNPGDWENERKFVCVCACVHLFACVYLSVHAYEKCKYLCKGVHACACVYVSHQKAPEILPSLSPQYYDYRHVLPCLSFTWDLGVEFRSSCSYCDHFTHWSIFPGSVMHLSALWPTLPFNTEVWALCSAPPPALTLRYHAASPTPTQTAMSTSGLWLQLGFSSVLQSSRELSWVKWIWHSYLFKTCYGFLVP